MSVGAAWRASSCRTTVAALPGAARIHSIPHAASRNAPSSSFHNPRTVSAPHPIIWTRGKRTTTKAQLKDLPQGTSALVNHDTPDQPSPSPGKDYPRMLQQHLDNMRRYPDCVILTRVGDFYELYFDQVERYAPLVNLRQARKGSVPMAGFQYTQLPRYLKMFVNDLGKQVAISEQVAMGEDDAARGMKFDRKVSRIVSAGTLIDEEFLDPAESNYLLAVHFNGPLPQPATSDATQRSALRTDVGLSWVDISSGELYTQATKLSSLPSLIAGIKPSEVVLSSVLQQIDDEHLRHVLGDGGHAVHFHPLQDTTSPRQWIGSCTSMLERPLQPIEIVAFSEAELRALGLACSFLCSKLIDTEVKLQMPVRKTDDEYMTIDRQSIRGLELRSTLREDRFEGSLLHAVRRTVTKGGTRLLTRRLLSPSMSLAVINERLDLVQHMLRDRALREDTVALLRKTADVRRLLQRFSVDKGTADDLLALSGTVAAMGGLASRLHEYIITSQEVADDAGLDEDADCLWALLKQFDLDTPGQLAKAIAGAIDQEGLDQVRMDELGESEGDGEDQKGINGGSDKASSGRELDTDSEIWIMRRSASPTLRAAHIDLDKLLQKKQALLLQLRQQLKAESLTFKWTAQLGHHCHLKSTRNGSANVALLSGARPIGSTKSTRTFYLAEWTELGVVIDDAKLRIRKAEEAVFEGLRAKVIENLMRLRRNASVLDELDVACSSAVVAKERNLIRPLVNASTAHSIFGGRHPTVDAGLTASGKQFTSNDCMVGSDHALVYLITGPNMGGKSTYLRQNALITILAQTGLYVPAASASIGLVDKIFSRIGSADNLYQDQSTFMVEMLETAEILKGATRRSFVVMDEVGRGTAPQPGTAVSFAVLKHLHEVNQCRALFATHFHDLADMAEQFPRLQCWCTDVDENVGQNSGPAWSYMHRLRPGVNRESHALKVMEIASMPKETIDLAEEVLRDRERIGRK